jgi:hypothetical protein
VLASASPNNKKKETDEINRLTSEPSCKDEARIGQKNKITRRWAKRGSRPSAPRDQRTASTYIFGAVCPEQGKGAGLILPACNTEAMNLHLVAIAAAVAPGAHAVLLADQAGWHMSTRLVVPPNITIIALLAWRIQERFYQAARWPGPRRKIEAGPRLKPGTVLMHEHRGVRHTVTVVPDGFVWQERTHASLSTIARAITGISWNGPRFFGLRVKTATDRGEADQ